MRTEDDLRAALTALERHAPAAARVLPGSKRRRSGHGLRSPRTIRLLSVATTTAALAGVVTALILPNGANKAIPNGGVASSAPLTKATLQAKLLAAFSGIGNEIVYMHGTFQTTGLPHTDPSPATDDVWYYPGQPSAGQQVRARTRSVQAGFGSTDTGVSFVEPAPQASPLPPGAVQVKGERISVDYLAKTWSDVKDTPVMFQPPYNPALIASYFQSKQWSARNTTWNSRPAIELTLKEVDLKGKTTVNSWTEYLWVDASTYLPLHDVTTFGPPGGTTHAVEDFQYLPTTPANLAKLTPPRPAGFKQVTPPKMNGVNDKIAGSANNTSPRPSPAPSNSPAPAPSHSPSPR
jgi:hypothetical protein